MRYFLETRGGRPWWTAILPGFASVALAISGLGILGVAPHATAAPDDLLGEAARAPLTSFVEARDEEASAHHLVIVLHGFLRTSWSVAALEEHLGDEGRDVINWGYRTTDTRVDATVDQLAEALREALESRPADTRVDVVAHSMGGLVARRLAQRHPELPLGRIVTIGTPHQGAQIAALAGQFRIYRGLLGAGATVDLEPGSELLAELPPEAPAGVPVGVIVGGRGDEMGYNPLIGGDDDGIVGVLEAELPGAADTLFLADVHHAALRHDARVLAAVTSFLETGTFGAS